MLRHRSGQVAHYTNAGDGGLMLPPFARQKGLRMSRKLLARESGTLGAKNRMVASHRTNMRDCDQIGPSCQLAHYSAA